MRLVPTTRCPISDQSVGLRLFAQRLNELLFDYTLDSYQARALNTHTRSRELLDAVISVKRESLRPQILGPIVEELADSIRADSAAGTLLGRFALRLASTDYWEVKNLRELETKAAWLRRQLGSGRYREEIVAQLRVLIPRGKEKGRISDLTRDLVVEWIDDGFPKQAIYFRCNRAFFDPNGPSIKSPESFDSFVAQFKEGPSEFEVVLRGNAACKMLSQAMLPPPLQMVEGAPAPRTSFHKEHEFLGKEGVFSGFPLNRPIP